MGAYLRAVRKTDLPPPLRPLAGRHQKMLARHRSEILAELESNDALRKLIVEWLDDKPGLPKADAAALRLAAERPEGWHESLAEQTAPAKEPTRPRAPRKVPVDSAAEERAKRAKEEARQARADASRELGAAKRREEKLSGAIAGLEASVKELEKELAAARQDAERARAEAEREIRKARRRAEDAEATARDARKESQALRREAERAERAGRVAQPRPVRKRQPTASAPRPPAKRKRLTVPQGRLEDAPETLEEWLQEEHVHLLVDGYNVSKAPGGFGDLELETQRRLLVEGVGELARRHGLAATIVFDGSEVPPGTSRLSRAPVEVEYSRPDEIADDHLIAKLEALPTFPVIVATNDRELQNRAARLGATIATSDQLLAAIR